MIPIKGRNKLNFIIRRLSLLKYMNNKLLKFIIIAGVILLFLFCVIAALDYSQKKTVESQPAAPSAVINIATPKGQVQINDVTKNPIQQVQDTVVVDRKSNFNIVYITSDKAFLITLESQPLQPARDAAEQAFLSDLQISKGDACKLTVSLSVPYDVGPDLSGKNFGLSFCPNGIPF